MRNPTAVARAAAAGMAGLSRPLPPAAWPREAVDVAVVGGGVAGLTCAVGLRRAGLKVLLLEKDNLLGGRASSWTDAKTGDAVHIGPHVLLSERAYPNFMQLLRELGTSDRVVWQPRGEITTFTGTARLDISATSLPPPLHFLPSFVRDTSVSTRAKLSAVPVSLLAMQMREPDFLALDAVDARSFLRSTGVAEEHISRWWEFISMAIMNVPLAMCSAGALLRFYARLLGHGDVRFGFPDGGLGDAYEPAAVRELAACGVEVRTEATVARLRTEGDAERPRVTGIELADGSVVEARTVVAAVPPQDLLRTIPGAWAESAAPFASLRTFEPCPYICVYLWLDRKVTDLQFWARSHDPQDLNCDFYDYANITRGYLGTGSFIQSNIIYSHRAAALDDAAIVRRTLAELRENLPGARHARALHSRVHRVPMAIHCPRPGTERARPPTRPGVDGLVLAGDWVRTALPSSMESAAASGWAAAEAVLEEQGREREGMVVRHRDTEGLAGVMRRWGGRVPLYRRALEARGIRVEDGA